MYESYRPRQTVMGDPILELDGAAGEGGGQILRSSLTLALLTGRSFRLRNIRAGRAKPGLQPQHLQSVQAAATIGGADINGAQRGSSTIEFMPGPVKAGNYRFRIGTAGATSLVLQTIYLPLALAKGRSIVTIEGGTHVTHSPCFHFLDRTWRAYLAQLGLNVSLRMHRPGFYPRGGGEIEAEFNGSAIPRSVDLGPLQKPVRARVLSAVAGLPEAIGHRQARRAANRLANWGLKIDTHDERWEGGPGTMLAIELGTAPAPTFFFAIGARGKRAEAVADEAVGQVEAFLAADPLGIDEHSADQILLPLAFAAGASSFRTAAISSHLRTNASVIQQFLPRDIQCVGEDGQPGSVQLD